MNDHDCRQLRAMKQQIEAYRKGDIDLGWLISSLESLRHALEAVPDAWVDLFWSRWGVLEELYSVSVVREQPMSDKASAEVNEVLEAITSMISAILPSSEGDNPC